MRLPAPLPEHKVPYEDLAAWRRENGAWPTPATAPEVFEDRLAAEGFALAGRERFVGGDGMVADLLSADGAFARALANIRERAARQWLWTNRERLRLAGRRLVLPADLTAEDRAVLRAVEAEVVKLLRDGEVTDWFLAEREAVGST